MYRRCIANLLFPMRQFDYSLKQHLRYSSSKITQTNICDKTQTSLFCEKLKDRRLIQLTGPDSSSLLQGLITNDVYELNDNKQSIFSFFLNIQGRILYDLLLYQSNAEHLFIECDENVTTELITLMKRYKIRKKVNIKVINDEFHLWSIFPQDESIGASNIELSSLCNNDKIILTNDPRVETFGWRAISSNSDKLPIHFSKDIEMVPCNLYKSRRLLMGIGEGIVDFPSGNCFPLESNAVFLNGVSFTKGCFIGQELTARTQHLGVTRKRLMPISFKYSNHSCGPGGALINKLGKKCGNLRSICGRNGIALLRLPDVIGKGSLTAIGEDDEKFEVDAVVPKWWDSTSDRLLTQLLLQSINDSLT